MPDFQAPRAVPLRRSAVRGPRRRCRTGILGFSGLAEPNLALRCTSDPDFRNQVGFSHHERLLLLRNSARFMLVDCVAHIETPIAKH
jgi:hypothetical protein